MHNAIAEISLALHRSTSVLEAARRLLTAIDVRLGAQGATILLLEAGVFHPICGAAPSDAAIRLPGGLQDRLEAGKPVRLVDYRATSLRQLGATIAYPMCGRDGLVGLVTVHRPSATTHETLLALVPHAAIAIENNAPRAVATDAGPLLAATRRFASARSMRDLYAKVLDEALRISGADRVSLMIVDGAELAVRAVKGLPDLALEGRINRGEVPCVRLERGQGIAGKAWETCAEQFVQKAAESSNFSKRNGRTPGAILCLPLVDDDGEVHGVLNLTSADPYASFNEGRRELLRAIARSASLAVAHLRVHDAAVTDTETGMRSAGLIHAVLDDALRRSQTTGKPVAAVLCQLGYNGDGMSEAALGRALRRSLGEYADHAGYLGGRRFLVVLTDTDATGARCVARRLAQDVAPFRGPRSGFVSVENRADEGADRLIRRLLITLGHELRPPVPQSEPNLIAV